MEKVIGLYLSAQTAVDDPLYLDTLQGEIGLTHVLLRGPVRLSDPVQARSPFRLHASGSAEQIGHDGIIFQGTDSLLHPRLRDAS